jgi:hypothetical protein
MRIPSLLGLGLLLLGSPLFAAEPPAWIESAKSGAWSDGGTWAGGKVPAASARVFVKTGHVVEYDLHAETPIRAVFIAGTVKFSRTKDTLLNVGLVRIEGASKPSEEGFECDSEQVHDHSHGQHGGQATLEVGTAGEPIPAGRTARIRLIAVDGQDPQSCPAIVCCGGKLDLHGAPLSRTWLKLGATAKKGEAALMLAEPVTGWRVGDRVIITATKLGRDNGGSMEDLQTEERVIQKIDGATLTLDKPLANDHRGEGEFRGEVANLSRNVIVESAEPDGVRGHTMYHRNSAGSISYAEFRHLGKKNVLGRYALHYHLIGNTMRGSSIVGASIWDSHNRWLTIHGTNYLLVRDCVGYQSIGHGFYLEDGTEILNTLDRNLAVQSMHGKKLPKQVLPFDQNEGSGFWWANSFNTFTRNVSCENDRYGFRFEATQTSAFDLKLPIQQRDGSLASVDIRTLPFVRFEDNEAHCDGLYGINLGEGVNRVGPDEQHPFVMRNTKIWEVHYAFRPQSPALLVDGLHIHQAIYGVYHPNFDRHVYRNVTISRDGNGGDAEPFNRGHDDDDTQYGTLTVDGLTFSGHRYSSMPLIQISDHNPTGSAESHFRNVKVTNRQDKDRRALVNLGGGPRPTPKTPTSVPVYIHDYFGPGKHAKVVSTKSGEFKNAGSDEYRAEQPLTGDESRVAEVSNVKFPDLLHPVDDQPPATVITSVRSNGKEVLVRGVSSDNGEIKTVFVNGKPAKAVQPNFAEWEITLPAGHDASLTALATDATGNREQTPHILPLGHAH